MQYKETQSKKYRKPLDQIMFYRGNVDEPRSQCLHCNKVFNKQNARQIVYFCSKVCRKDFKPNTFKIFKSQGVK